LRDFARHRLNARKNRIAVLYFSHETVTFPTNDTTLAIK